METILGKNCYMKEQCPYYRKNEGHCNHVEENTHCVRLFKLDTLFNNALLTDKQKLYTPLWMPKEKPDYEAFVRLSGICKNIDSFVKEGSSLYIYSAHPGNGKTTWALKLLRSYLGSQWATSDFKCHALFINVPRYFLSLKDNISNPSEYVQYIKDNINTADLVVFDEVGVKGLTEFEHEHFLNMVNTRIEAGLANIYTSNMASSELKEKIGDRLFSRIYNLSEHIEFLCDDYRGKKE